MYKHYPITGRPDIHIIKFHFLVFSLLAETLNGETHRKKNCTFSLFWLCCCLCRGFAVLFFFFSPHTTLTLVQYFPTFRACLCAGLRNVQSVNSGEKQLELRLWLGQKKTKKKRERAWQLWKFSNFYLSFRLSALSLLARRVWLNQREREAAICFCFTFSCWFCLQPSIFDCSAILQSTMIPSPGIHLNWILKPPEAC